MFIYIWILKIIVSSKIEITIIEDKMCVQVTLLLIICFLYKKDQFMSKTFLKNVPFRKTICIQFIICISYVLLSLVLFVAKNTLFIIISV